MLELVRITFPRPATPPADQERVPTAEPSPNLPPKTVEPFKPSEITLFPEKPAFIPPKPVPHSPKISPSSIPNPNPSATATMPMEPGYPNYGSYLYSIPGYSAFQPISYPGSVQTTQETNVTVQNEVPKSEFIPFPSSTPESIVDGQSNKQADNHSNKQTSNQTKAEDARPQTDFEDHFTTEIIPTVSVTETEKSSVSKLSITSLIQGSGATVTIPSQTPCKDVKKKPAERFSLKTSIPISKIDMKCVSNPPDTMFQHSINKKPAFQTPNPKMDTSPRVEIQSNIVIKTANKEPEPVSNIKPAQTTGNNNINTLINAAEAISKSENQFWNTEEGTAKEIHDSAPVVSAPSPSTPVFNSINTEPKVNFPNKPPDGTFNEQQKQILFIQNKHPSNPKMLLTIQQQNPQVLLQRTSFESKNLQAPSRLSNQNKKCKEDVVGDSTASKVVALKRLHQENCDENDFENLITENQIYGNKIVVKEKSQGTQQEQDLKNNNKVTDKQVDTKNVVLQPNFLYLSNVQFPANLMMIKNNTKITQTNDSTKVIVTSNENKVLSEVNTITNTTDVNPIVKSPKTQNVVVSKDIHVLKSSNNVLQTISNKNNKTDLVFQANQKVIMSPQIVYQVPMIVDADNKLNHRDYPKFIGQKVEYSKPLEQKPNDKLYIACPYQMDSKLQPKIVITNIRPKVTKIDEISSLDIYEKRRRMRRLKHLSNRDNKEAKTESKKGHEKHDNLKNIITPNKMDAEIFKEFVNTKAVTNEGSSDSDSDYGEEEIKEYASIIKQFGNEKENNNGKVEFLGGLRLATRDAYKERELEIQEKILRADAVASAYIAAGRLDRLCNDVYPDTVVPTTKLVERVDRCDVFVKEDGVMLQRKHSFLSELQLTQVSPQYKEGYERSWQEIIKERKRRYGTENTRSKNNILITPVSNGDFDPNNTLQLLTEIKKCVNDTNNLIKKRLDSFCDENSNEYSIRALAEKNFSELDRLSKMADKSVKLFSGQNTRKRDLNPGFDSENIKKPVFKCEPSVKNYPKINIPNYSKIVSLKQPENSPEVACVEDQQILTIQEDEPVMITCEERTKEVSCQANDETWPGLEAIRKSFKEFDSARKKEISELHRRNTALRVEGALITRAASRDSDRARALLAERHNLALEENRLTLSIQKLYAAIDAVRKC